MVIGSFDSYWQALNLPEINAEHCVHAVIAGASCRACVDVCHARAWQMDDSKPGIDPDLCDGCGICAAVCPEAAIVHPHNPLSILWRSERIALIACEKIPDRLSSHSDGVVSCVHALSIRDLIKLYVAGHQRLLVCTASCKECSRGADRMLDKHLHALNSLLRARDEPLLERVNISINQWLSILRSADHSNTGKKLSRRNFLRRAASEISDYGLRQFELSMPEQTTSEPVAKLLFNTADGKALLYVPQIDAGCCTACDTCIKLCPHHALTLDEKEGSIAYLINAEKCTACGICVDVCEDKAITINRNTLASETVLELTRCQCQVCGVGFHTLDATPGHTCSICQKKNHQPQLFQVLD